MPAGPGTIRPCKRRAHKFGTIIENWTDTNSGYMQSANVNRKCENPLLEKLKSRARKLSESSSPL